MHESPLLPGYQLLAFSVVGEGVVTFGPQNLGVRGAGLERLAAEFPFVKFSGLQLAFEQGLAKEFQWRQLLGKKDDDVYYEVMELASRDSVLGGMYPLLGHKFVLLRDEYSDDALASIFVTRPGWFRIYERAGEGAEFEEDAPVPVEFEGDAQAMVAYLSRKLSLDSPANTHRRADA
jgi:hypothetical protein